MKKKAYKEYTDNGGLLQSNPWFAFEAGWDSAIKNDAGAQKILESLWHNPEEEPVGDYWTILCHDEIGFLWSVTKDNLYDIYTDWQEAIACEMIDKWAYADDFFPKNL